MQCSQKHLLGTPSPDGYYDDEELPAIDPMMLGAMGNNFPNNMNINYNTNGYMAQPITPPEVEQMPNNNGYIGNVGMPSLNNQMVFPNSYQDFSNMGGNVIQGQISPEGAYGLYDHGQYPGSNGVTTPGSSFDYNNLFSPNSNGIKLECVDDLFNNLSELTSSQESDPGFRVPVLTNFPGKYEFSVEPFEKSGKKCLLWADSNKIFCCNEVEILFSLKMKDFQHAPLKELSLETMLVYSANQHVMEPVARCSTDIEIEKKNNNGVDKELFRHVLRSSCPRAEYRTKENSRRRYVSEPLEKPQPGETSILRNFRFMCLNSCRLGMNKRGASILFYLMERGKEVGRHCFHIKICKCPTRDWKKEHEKKETGGKRKMVSPPVPVGQNRCGKQKKLRPSTSPVAGGSGTGSRRASASPTSDKTYLSPDTDEEILSQGSQACMCGSNKLSVVSELELVLAHRRNPDPACKQVAGLAWDQYKSFRKIVGFFKTHVLKDGEADAGGGGQGQEPHGNGNAVVGMGQFPAPEPPPSEPGPSSSGSGRF